MTAIVIISRTRGRTPTRGKSNARPLSSGMEISNIYRERGAFTASAICHRVLFVSVERVVRAFPSCNLVGFLAGGSSLTHDTKSARIKFARAFKAARRLFSGLSRFQACKQSSRGVGPAFQELILSAQAMSLAAGVYGQHIGRREMKCPTKSLKDPTK